MNPHNRIYLLYGTLASLFCLTVLFVIKLSCPKLLELDVRWLIVAGVPILVSLIAGDFIKKFSGFGLDLELIAKEPIGENGLIIDLSQPSVAKDKLGLPELENIPLNERSLYNVLKFKLGKNAYYTPEAVAQHLNTLSNIVFFETVDDSGQFKSLTIIPVGSGDHLFYYDKFIKQVEEGRIMDSISTTFEFVFDDQSIIETLKRIKNSGRNFIAVINQRRELVGIAYKERLEAYLANAFIKFIDREK
jgi:hypothetical protein